MVALLDAYLARFEVAPQFDAGDVAHYLLPILGVVHSYVVEADGAPPLHTLPKRRASLCARAPSRLAVDRTVTDAGSARRRCSPVPAARHTSESFEQAGVLAMCVI